jgi:hypothetical protein
MSTLSIYTLGRVALTGRMRHACSIYNIHGWALALWSSKQEGSIYS